MNIPRHVLPVVVAAQFCCTSLWFAGNAVVNDLALAYDLGENALAHLTSAVQFGFICGTFFFALFSVSDRNPPSAVFFACALLGAAVNLSTLLPGHSLYSLVGVRFATGVCLAGIYPVGMKIAADYHEKGLGKALGFLVGALVLGTAFPHLLRSFPENLSWQPVFVITSVLSAAAGLCVFVFVPDGPFRKKGAGFNLSVSYQIFRDPQFRRAAFGYFGHMWELYTLWAFLPAFVALYNSNYTTAPLQVSSISFLSIASGSLACIAGGYAALRCGSAKVAATSLFSSGLCCLMSPLAWNLTPVFFTGFLTFWGMVVIADSPQFSTLVARTAPKENTGTALTIVNCLGFSITIVSIEALSFVLQWLDPRFMFLLLLPGPAFGLYSILQKRSLQIQT